MVKSGWHLIKTAHGGPIHAQHDPSDHKHKKFLEMFGFERSESLDDGTEIWIWRNT
jgi:hypothetical protein